MTEVKKTRDKKPRDTVSFKVLTYAGQVVGLGAESLLTADESPTLGTPTHTHNRSEFTRRTKNKKRWGPVQDC
jgi:hypothetical protein